MKQNSVYLSVVFNVSDESGESRGIDLSQIICMPDIPNSDRGLVSTGTVATFIQ